MLQGFRVDGHVGEAEIFSLIRDLLLFPQPAHDLQAFLKATSPLLPGNTKSSVRVSLSADAGHEREPAVGNDVQSRDLFGKQNRWKKGRHGEHANLHLSGQGGNAGNGGDVLEIVGGGGDVMITYPDGVQPCLPGRRDPLKQVAQALSRVGRERMRGGQRKAKTNRRSSHRGTSFVDVALSRMYHTSW